MNRAQLRRLLQLASRLASDPDVLVLGSQSILGSYEESELPDSAVMSIEADLAFLDDQDRRKADLVDAVLGELTEFHQAQGIYAEGIHVDTAILPDGWRDRLVRWSEASEGASGVFLDKHDLALSKLAAGRAKDHAFVGDLVKAELIDPDTLRKRLELMPPTLPPVLLERLRSSVVHLAKHRESRGGWSLRQITSIATAAERADGAAPLDEATRLALRHHPDRVTGKVTDAGFALLNGEELSLVVDPAQRGRGYGDALASEVLNTAQDVTAWSHGDHPAARVLAQRHGFEPVRELWVMRRTMSEPLPDVPALEQVTIRGYRPEDEGELLRVNGAAFAAHPEQGGMDSANLAERMAEPWFDSAGLLVAERDGRMVGFHWTKQHSAALGEVYVVGIDPSAQGGGLGKALTLAGLHHLASQGVDEVLLYVESDNAPAIAVYAGLGFTHADHDTHVMYRRG